MCGSNTIEVYFLLIQQFEVTLLVRETINPLWGESITQTDRGSTIFHAQLPTAMAVSAPGGQEREWLCEVLQKAEFVHVRGSPEPGHEGHRPSTAWSSVTWEHRTLTGLTH